MMKWEEFGRRRYYTQYLFGLRGYQVSGPMLHPTTTRI
jgi:hypothetical protein